MNTAVEINVLNYNIAVWWTGLKAENRALASIGFITQRALCTMGRSLAGGRQRGAAHCPPLQ